MKLPRLSQYLQEVGLTPDELKAARRDSMQDIGKIALSSAKRLGRREDTQLTFKRLLDADNPGSLVAKLKDLLDDHIQQKEVPSQAVLNPIFAKINTFLNSRSEIKSDKDKDDVVADAIARIVPEIDDRGRFPMYLSLALHKGWLIFDKSHVDQKFERSDKSQEADQT
jgi:hypothetical protein